MGYAHYTLADGREAGYSVTDVCNEPDVCNEKIDRGLGYLCGGTPGGDEYGCGGYFCGAHLYGGPDECVGGQCARCLAAWERDNPEMDARFAFGVYDTAGQLVAAHTASTVNGDDPTYADDLQDVAETVAAAYPGFEVCVWRDAATTMPTQRVYATPDAIADRR